MKKITFILIFLTISTQLIAQISEPHPVPDCRGIMRVGSDFDTLYWVNGIAGAHEDECDSLVINVLTPPVTDIFEAQDYAYGFLPIELFTQTSSEEIDFSINLNNTFESLNFVREVTIAELRDYNNIRLGQITLSKGLNGSVFNLKPGSTVNLLEWRLKVKWYLNSQQTTEDVFEYGPEDTINFNYIWDASDSTMPVSMLYLGDGRSSIYPSDMNGNENMPLDLWDTTGEIKSIRLGAIGGTYHLSQGDKIVFDLNISNSNLIE